MGHLGWHLLLLIPACVECCIQRCASVLSRDGVFPSWSRPRGQAKSIFASHDPCACRHIFICNEVHDILF